MGDRKLPRKRPCASCPYRRDVPSGVWAASEYAKLPQYDGDIADQVQAGATRLFCCHQADGSLCAGWAGYRDPADLLAVRLGLASDAVDPAILDYTTNVPLWSSGQEAADHGMAECDAPGEDAARTIAKLKAHVSGLSVG